MYSHQSCLNKFHSFKICVKYFNNSIKFHLFGIFKCAGDLLSFFLLLSSFAIFFFISLLLSEFECDDFFSAALISNRGFCIIEYALLFLMPYWYTNYNNWQKSLGITMASHI